MLLVCARVAALAGSVAVMGGEGGRAAEDGPGGADSFRGSECEELMCVCVCVCVCVCGWLGLCAFVLLL